MAAQGLPGSSVTICTDGLANVGLGSIEGNEQEEAMAFYGKLAEYAKEKGVTVNIVSIVGEECDLATLSPLTSETGGTIERVEADKLRENFANVLASPVIASNVVLKVKLHKGLEFRNEDEDNIEQAGSFMVKTVGNVTADQEITFEYRLKDAELLAAIPDIDFTELKSIPFQTQIEFTKLDGMKCVRVITKVLEISNDREEVEQDADMDILQNNVDQQAAKRARRGSFRGA